MIAASIFFFSFVFFFGARGREIWFYYVLLVDLQLLVWIGLASNSQRSTWHPFPECWGYRHVLPCPSPGLGTFMRECMLLLIDLSPGHRDCEVLGYFKLLSFRSDSLSRKLADSLPCDTL